MSVYIVCDGTTYSNIKSISFEPEYDPTLTTLPICQFEVQIVTDAAPETFIGKWADLHEDLGYENATNTLLAGWYEVAEAEQTDPGVVRVLAKSLLAWLDKRTLSGEYFNGVDFTEFVEHLFFDLPLIDGQPIWPGNDPPVTYRSGINAQRVYGWCPEQTARERLQMVCQSQMMRVVQYGVNSASGLYITNSPDSTTVNPIGTRLIEFQKTYFKPEPRRKATVAACRIIRYTNFRETLRTGEYWDSVVMVEGWKDSQTGEEQVEQRLYYQWTPYDYKAAADAEGELVEIKSNLLMYLDTQLANIAATYFRNYEVEADVLQVKHTGNEDYIWPGDRVWFYLDADTICRGVIKSAVFTFGMMARAKLIIASDLAPVATGTLNAVYQYYSDASFHTFMTITYHLPPYAVVNIPSPLYVSVWEGDTVRHLRAAQPGWITDNGPAVGQTRTRTIFYNRS